MVGLEVESTLAIIKPDAFPRADDIINLIKEAGYVIPNTDQVLLSKQRAADFYAEHADRPFYNDLVQYMASAPSLVLVLRKQAAIASWRQMIGPTVPDTARKTAPNSIRAKFGTDPTNNAVHGSDSAESAAREIAFFFPDYSHPGKVKGADAKDYLNKTVCATLTKALTEMCGLNPRNPVEWLGRYMLREANVQQADMPKPKRRIFFVLGGPGSGKGTQCSFLVERFGFDHFSAGDLLRAEVASGSQQGVMVGEMIKEGKIVPGEITINLLKNAIEGSNAPGVLIDGFPRQLGQAGSFEKDVSDFEFVLFFDCPEEEMERRLLQRGQTSGRSDDNIESIRKRFNTFVQTSMPVIEYYEAKGKVHRIDATKTKESIAEYVASLF